jgi:hypothetical protein
MHPVFEGGDVNVDDVAVPQHRVVWDAMANDFIDRRADGLGKPAVADG